MASKFKMKDNDPKIKYVVQRCPNGNHPWFPADCAPFTLQQNHVYGHSKPDKIYFVLITPTAADLRNNTITIRYHAEKNGRKSWDNYRKISMSSPLGKAIMEQFAGPITYGDEHKTVRKLAPKRRNIRYPYLPMPRMRIPGGTYGNHSVLLAGDHVRRYLHGVDLMVHDAVALAVASRAAVAGK